MASFSNILPQAPLGWILTILVIIVLLVLLFLSWRIKKGGAGTFVRDDRVTAFTASRSTTVATSMRVSRSCSSNNTAWQDPTSPGGTEKARRVVLCGLQSDTSLNDKVAEVLSEVLSEGRHKVRIVDTDVEKMIKPENMRPFRPEHDSNLLPMQPDSKDCVRSANIGDSPATISDMAETDASIVEAGVKKNGSAKDINFEDKLKMMMVVADRAGIIETPPGVPSPQAPPGREPPLPLGAALAEEAGRVGQQESSTANGDGSDAAMAVSPSAPKPSHSEASAAPGSVEDQRTADSEVIHISPSGPDHRVKDEAPPCPPLTGTLTG